MDVAINESNQNSVAVVIPCFNEAESIEGAFLEAYAALSKLKCEFKIIIVDDGSGDHTATIVEELAASLAEVRLERHRTLKKRLIVQPYYRPSRSRWSHI